jgi:hypothetical protein
MVRTEVKISMKKKYSACLYFKLLKSYPNKYKTTWTFATLLHKWINILNIKLSFHIETKKNVASHIGLHTLDPEIKSLMLYRLS